MIFTARWVLPIVAPPVAGGWIDVAEGRIREVGRGRAPAGARDLGRVAILPSLVNAHTHLELSYLRNVVPPAPRFLDWIAVLMAKRRAFADPADPQIVQAARDGIRELRAAGTGLVGDISNTLITIPLLREMRVPGHVFFELLRFDAPDPEGMVEGARARLDAAGASEDVTASLAPHAPYSVSPGLFAAIRRDVAARGDRTSVHLGESREEVEFILTGGGPWRQLLQGLGVWTDAWRPPGVSPVAYLDALHVLDARTLVVHGVQFTPEDLAIVRRAGATVVSCPRSNRHVGVGSPPIDKFYGAGVPVAFGTDSLASVEDLNVFAELAEARRLAPSVPARVLLESATLTGARALGFGDRLGSVEAGKSASLIAVQVPDGVEDVEEYLVAGVRPDHIGWLDA